MRSGDPRRLARAISLAEADEGAARQLLTRLGGTPGRAVIVGLTGSPGTGKSTLVDRLVAHIRGLDRSVGVVAVDPTSPFTGGAILGDRIRMQRHFLDPGVFIRSMGARGHLGGLSSATSLAVELLDASGRETILIETVGVGQSELEVASAADVVVVVLAPGAGDHVQALKAGILEIADVLAVNKDDQPGSDRLVQELRGLLALAPPSTSARPHPLVVRTQGLTGEGVSQLWDAVETQRGALESSGGLAERRRQRALARVLDIVEERARRRARARLEGTPELAAGVDPYRLADLVEDAHG